MCHRVQLFAYRRGAIEGQFSSGYQFFCNISSLLWGKLIAIKGVEDMPETTGRKKILVVDDDRTITTMLESVLTSHGYTVLLAYDGLDALVQVRKNSPDLIILDIMMPEINGYDVCSNLKFDEKYKHIPIIVLTVREQELDPRIAKLMGVEYMQKPINREALLEKITNALK